MKHHILSFCSVFAIILCIGLEFSACKGAKQENNNQENPYGECEMALHTYTNINFIYSGILYLKLKTVMEGRGTEMLELLREPEWNETERIEALDSMIASFDKEVLQAIDTIPAKLDRIYDLMKTEKPEMYVRVFGSGEMKQGVRMAEKYGGTHGFEDVTAKISTAALRRYIFKISALDDTADTNDIHAKFFRELAPWMRELTHGMEEDWELREFFKGAAR